MYSASTRSKRVPGSKRTTCAAGSPAKGWKRLVAHGSFVHHAGHRTYQANGSIGSPGATSTRRASNSAGVTTCRRPFPLVSACLIVKDEEENLPRCLASLEDLADEIVVYDTGSTDGTVAVGPPVGCNRDRGLLGRRLLASPQRGVGRLRWRLDRLARCRRGTPLSRRQRAAGLSWPAPGPRSMASAWSSRMPPARAVGSMFVHSACRFFRRSRCEWAGRLHEQVAGRGTHRPVATSAL